MVTRVEMHCHSKGSDGRGTAEQIAEAAALAKIDILCLTDHHRSDTAERQRVERACAKVGVRVAMGCEYSTQQGHLLIYGVAVEQFNFGHYPEMQRVIDVVNDAGGVAFPSHPFYGYKKVCGNYVYELMDIPGLETVNGQVMWTAPLANKRARLAANDLGVVGFGGSDAHDPWDIGNVISVFDHALPDDAALVAAIRGGKLARVHVREGLGNHGDTKEMEGRGRGVRRGGRQQVTTRSNQKWYF